MQSLHSLPPPSPSLVSLPSPLHHPPHPPAYGCRGGAPAGGVPPAHRPRLAVSFDRCLTSDHRYPQCVCVCVCVQFVFVCVCAQVRLTGFAFRRSAARSVYAPSPHLCKVQPAHPSHQFHGSGTKPSKWAQTTAARPPLCVCAALSPVLSCAAGNLIRPDPAPLGNFHAPHPDPA